MNVRERSLKFVNVRPSSRTFAQVRKRSPMFVFFFFSGVDQPLPHHVAIHVGGVSGCSAACADASTVAANTAGPTAVTAAATAVGTTAAVLLLYCCYMLHRLSFAAILVVPVNLDDSNNEHNKQLQINDHSITHDQRTKSAK